MRCAFAVSLLLPVSLLLVVAKPVVPVHYKPDGGLWPRFDGGNGALRYHEKAAVEWVDPGMLSDCAVLARKRVLARSTVLSRNMMASRRA